ncbi:MAG: DUF2799 domain-containing protein, partial [Bdellovibrionales bacterium]
FHSMRILAQPLLALVLACGLTGCATVTKPAEPEKATCEQVDWYELGRRDGSQGTPTDRLTAHQKECAKNSNPEWETIYTNGRNAGLVEYCDPKNAYELGRMGVAYYYVCPSTVETPFLASYRQGQKAREIEIQNQKLDDQIDQLGQKLVTSESSNEKKEINDQIEELKKARAKNDQELSKIITK